MPELAATAITITATTATIANWKYQSSMDLIDFCDCREYLVWHR